MSGKFALFVGLVFGCAGLCVGIKPEHLFYPPVERTGHYQSHDAHFPGAFASFRNLDFPDNAAPTQVQEKPASHDYNIVSKAQQVIKFLIDLTKQKLAQPIFHDLTEPIINMPATLSNYFKSLPERLPDLPQILLYLPVTIVLNVVRTAKFFLNPLLTTWFFVKTLRDFFLGVPIELLGKTYVFK